MKLASRRTVGRDGALVVVSRDLKTIAHADHIVPTLQAALEQWSLCAPALEELSTRLNAGEVDDAQPYDPTGLESPLPRAYQFLDGSAYLNHVELVRRARGAELPESLRDDPLMYQAVSDGFLRPCEPIRVADESWGIDFEAEVAVMLDDVAMGARAADAARAIRLVTLVNDVSLRNVIPAELAKGFGFVVGKPRSALAPMAVTPDELGDAWDGAKLNLPLVVHLNDRLIGKPNAGIDMNFDFARLIAHAAQTRPLAAGTIIGSGTVSNRDRGVGSCCLAEIRTIEKLETGQPTTPFMVFGDRVRIEMRDANGASIFGAIDQRVERYTGSDG